MAFTNVNPVTYLLKTFFFSLNFFLDLKEFYRYEYSVCMSMSVIMCVSGAHRGQKRAPDPAGTGVTEAYVLLITESLIQTPSQVQIYTYIHIYISLFVELTIVYIFATQS